MDRYVRLAYCYHDDDLVELEVSAWNGRFGGSTKLYVGQGSLAHSAELLSGFPKGVEDQREVALGALGSGQGAMSLKCSCVDGAGHCRVQVTVENDHDLRNYPAERVQMYAAVEPAVLDRFVEQMRELNSALRGSAVLSIL